MSAASPPDDTEEQGARQHAPPVVLASSSSVRRRLLERAGVPLHALDSPSLDEPSLMQSFQAQSSSPAQAADALACLKAQSVSARHPGCLVIGGDQILACGDAWLGRPRTPEHATAMLMQQSGQQVFLPAAAAIFLDGTRLWSFTAEPSATFRTFDEAEARLTVSLQGADTLRACGGVLLEGAGARLLASVSGDPFSLMGFPLLEALAFLRAHAVL